MKRKILCFMLTLALLISVLPAQSVFAASGKHKNMEGMTKYDTINTLHKPTYKSSKKKTLTATWDSSIGVGTNEFQISTSKKFPKSKTTTYYHDSKNVKEKFFSKDGKSFTSFTIKGLKSGKTYYVRYRSVEYGGPNEDRMTVYKWSKAKKIKVK